MQDTYIGIDPKKKNKLKTDHIRTKNPRALLYSAVSVPYASVTPKMGVTIAPKPP
jgi:hypothetical protein